MSALASTNTEHDPDATAAALPPELPPADLCQFDSSSTAGGYFGLKGLTTGPCAECTLCDLKLVSCELTETIGTSSPHAKLIAVCLADDMRPGLSEQPYDSCVIRRNEI